MVGKVLLIFFSFVNSCYTVKLVNCKKEVTKLQLCNKGTEEYNENQPDFTTGNAHLNGSLFKGGASLRYGGRFMDILTNPDLKSSFHHHHHHHKYHHHYHDWT